MRRNKTMGRKAREKVWDTVAFIQFKRKYRYSHQATKPIRVESSLTPEDLRVAESEGEHDQDIIYVDEKFENDLNTYEERQAKREKEKWEARFTAMKVMQQAQKDTKSTGRE